MYDHILVVDDDDSIRSLVSELLISRDYAVETAADGVKALEAIDRDPPSVMLLDMRMPVLDGWAVAASLRERHQCVPTVVMTAAAYTPDWSAEVHAEGCLIKPFDSDDLLGAVEQALGK
jgi:CheY-like chemotaxis protein